MDEDSERRIRGILGEILDSLDRLSDSLLREGKRRDEEHRAMLDALHAQTREARTYFDDFPERVARALRRDGTGPVAKVERDEIDGIDVRAGWHLSWSKVLKHAVPWAIALGALASQLARWMGITPGGKQ